MAIRNTQELVVVPAQPTDSTIRNTQEVVSAVALPTDSKIRSTQELFLAIALATDDHIRVTQHVLLVIEQRYFNPNLYRIIHPITVWQKQPETKPPQGFFQNAALLAATPVFANAPRPFITVRPQAEEHQNRPWIGRVPSRRRQGPFLWIVT